MKKRFRRWFYSMYYKVLVQRIFMHVEIGYTPNDCASKEVPKECYYTVHNFLNLSACTVSLPIDFNPDRDWAKQVRNMIMEKCYEKYWSLKGLKD